VKELVVISGKGGTGKTSILGSFAHLADSCVLADCDVDAADLHLLAAPRIEHREKYSGGKRARIRFGHCTACGKCAELCRFDAISYDGPGNGRVDRTFRIDPIACQGCGVCAHFCPEDAIEFAPAINGEWYRSRTRWGPMVHARLGIAEENSGKLVTLVRQAARQWAEREGRQTILVDGSPGIGCAVIAAVTGADLVLVVTEPTLSGLHDLQRVADLTQHFGIPTIVAINKWDLSDELTAQIEAEATRRGLPLAGRVRYDQAVTEAQIRGLSVVEQGGEGAATDITELWSFVAEALQLPG
jgi:MinD superfamily P-loop ATPase